MALAYKQLAQVQAASGVTTLYTTPAAAQTIVKSITVVNTDTSPRWIKMWNNGTADGDLILPQTTIPAGGYAIYDGTITMATTDTLSIQGEVGSKLTFTVHGAEVT